MNFYKVVAYVNRELNSHSERVAGFVFILLLLNLIFCGYFGIYRGYSAYTTKSEQIQTFSNVNEDLSSNIAILEELSPYLVENKGLVYLKKAIPFDNSSPAYVRNLSNAFGTNGFKLNRITFSPNNDHIRVNLTGEGRFNTFTELIQDIEDLERLSIIESIVFRTSYTDDKQIIVNITLRAYTLNEEEL